MFVSRRYWPKPPTRTFRRSWTRQWQRLRRRTLRSNGVLYRASGTREQITALAQAKLAFVSHLLALCGQFRVKAFASIVDRDAPRPEGDFLRKDYAYLFERYFYFRCQPWRAKRRLVVPSSREAALFSRRALRQRENKVGLRTRRPVIGSQVRSSNELAKLLRSAG